MRCFLLLLLFSLSVIAQDIPSYAKLKEAAVDILVDGNLSGSGAFISSEGDVLTAAHIFKDKAKIEVVNHKNERFKTSVVAIDRGHDLALLKTEKSLKVPYLKISDKKTFPGADVFHFGSAYFRRGMMQKGFVSQDEPSFEYYGGTSSHAVRVLHISTTVQPGTSGGPWVNKLGKIIGVQSGIMTINNSNSGMAFSAPLEAISKIVTTRKSANTPTLEITVETLWNQQAPVVANYPGYKNAVIIVAVNKDGVGAKFGLKKDDLIIALNNTITETDSQFYTLLRQNQPGQEVTLKIYRPSEKKELEIKLSPVHLEKRFEQIF